MALNDIEKLNCQKIVAEYVKRIRPKPDLRDQIDIAFRVDKQSVVIFEIRPNIQNSNEKMEIPVAKATYVRTYDVWKIYWQRADLKWHSYKPQAEVANTQGFIAVVEDDQYACFWG